MEGGKDKGKKEETLDPIMMDDNQIKKIMVTTRKTCSRSPYQYKVDTKKRAIATREGLASDEEEVEDLWAVEKIEEILCSTYEQLQQLNKKFTSTVDFWLDSIVAGFITIFAVDTTKSHNTVEQ
jgi:hypothetical protein